MNNERSRRRTKSSLSTAAMRASTAAGGDVVLHMQRKAMATRAKSICRHVGCGKAIAAPGYCETHKKEETGWFRSNAGRTSSQRGYGAAWRRVRDAVLRRDYGLCQPCQEQGRDRFATEVDHVVSKANGGSDDMNNLQAICRECHAAKTRRERVGGGGLGSSSTGSA